MPGRVARRQSAPPPTLLHVDAVRGTMRGRPWYKRYPTDFIQGCLGLGAAPRGCYDLVVDLIYDRGGPVPNDPKWLGKLLGESTRQTGNLVAYLIQHDKLQLTDDGRLTNRRAEYEIAKAEEIANKQAEGGRKPKPKPKPKEDQLDLPHVGPMDVQTALQHWNDTAARVGLPAVKILNPNRRKQLGNAIRTCGGVDGFRAMVERVAASRFLTGRTDKPFTASFDFVVRPSSLAKILEGNYDDERGGSAANGSGRQMVDPEADDFPVFVNSQFETALWNEVCGIRREREGIATVGYQTKAGFGFYFKQSYVAEAKARLGRGAA